MHDDHNTGAFGDYPMGHRPQPTHIPDTADELLEAWANPTWTRFDTVLRRLLMIGLILTVWVLFVNGMLFAYGMAQQGPPTDVYPANAPSLLACDPLADKDC